MPTGDPERKGVTIPKPKVFSVQERKRLSMKDVLLWAEGEPPRPGRRRIGIHTSTAGGVEMAAERAYRAGSEYISDFFFQPAAVAAVLAGAIAMRRHAGFAGEI